MPTDIRGAQSVWVPTDTWPAVKCWAHLRHTSSGPSSCCRRICLHTFVNANYLITSTIAGVEDKYSLTTLTTQKKRIQKEENIQFWRRITKTMTTNNTNANTSHIFCFFFIKHHGVFLPRRETLLRHIALSWIRTWERFSLWNKKILIYGEPSIIDTSYIFLNYFVKHIVHGHIVVLSFADVHRNKGRCPTAGADSILTRNVQFRENLF